MTTRVKPKVSVIYLATGQYPVHHLSLDGENPLCGQKAQWPYSKVPFVRTKSNCKLCREIVLLMKRKLK